MVLSRSLEINEVENGLHSSIKAVEVCLPAVNSPSYHNVN